MTKLRWPPTTYGEMCYMIILEWVRQERIKKADADELVALWFHQAIE